MSFPNTPVLDNFNRADGAPGANWTNSAFGDGACSILTNQVNGAAPTANGMAWVTAFGADQEAYVDVPALPTSGNLIDLVLRASGTSGSFNCYLLRVVPNTSTWTLRKITAGGASTLIGTYSAATALAAGDSYGFQASGTSLNAWKQTGGAWAQVGSPIVDASFLTGGQIGMEFETTVARMDNFGGGSLFAIRSIRAEQGVTRTSVT